MTAIFGKRRLVETLAAAVLLASSAHAAPSPADVATARELYKQGADALDAGNAKLAAEKLSAAWALVQTPVIGYDLARAQNALGHLVEAREAALSVQRLAVAHDETARSTEARNDAAKVAAQLEPRIPHIALDVRGLEGHDATVKLDGNIIPGATLSVARQANPGTHIATVDADDGRHAESTLDIAERETKTIVVQLDAPRAPVVVTPLPEPQKPPAEPLPVQVHASPERGHLSPLVWIGIVTTGVGLATGALTGAFALNEASTVKQDCTLLIDTKLVCGPNDTGHLSAANALGVVSTIGFVAGGAGVALLVTGLALGPSHGNSKSAWIVPFIGPITGVRGEF